MGEDEAEEVNAPLPFVPLSLSLPFFVSLSLSASFLPILHRGIPIETLHRMSHRRRRMPRRRRRRMRKKRIEAWALAKRRRRRCASSLLPTSASIRSTHARRQTPMRLHWGNRSASSLVARKERLSAVPSLATALLYSGLQASIVFVTTHPVAAWHAGTSSEVQSTPRLVCSFVSSARQPRASSAKRAPRRNAIPQNRKEEACRPVVCV